VLAVARGDVPPATYSVVEQPQMTLRALLAHYARQAGTDPQVVSLPLPGAGRPRGPLAVLKAAARRWAAGRRDMLLGLVPLSEERTMRLKLAHLAASAAAASQRAEVAGAMTIGSRIGHVPGLRLPTTAGTRRAGS